MEGGKGRGKLVREAKVRWAGEEGRVKCGRGEGGRGDGGD